ncbi:MAG: hypothetical protein S4CHLAM6_13870 [Chlamydiae bacterium]|nr:hypothetical protein [Chlamydiota bacterium]
MITDVTLKADFSPWGGPLGSCGSSLSSPNSNATVLDIINICVCTIPLFNFAIQYIEGVGNVVGQIFRPFQPSHDVCMPVAPNSTAARWQFKINGNLSSEQTINKVQVNTRDQILFVYTAS